MQIPVVEIVLLVALGLALWQWRSIIQLKKQVLGLQCEVAGRSEQSAEVKAASIPAEVLSVAKPIITIELDNPLAVAGNEVKGADIAGALAPAVVKKRVYQEVRKELSSELADRGIAARVNVLLQEKV